MRRLLIRGILPILICLVPPLAAVLVAAVIPPAAVTFFIKHLADDKHRLDHYMDILILGVGVPLFITQMLLCFLSLQWRGTGFYQSPDKWVNNLSQAAEWFPMLGLLGTVGGILQTFASFEGVTNVSPNLIIAKYAPAITATGCGLYMAFINMLPPWFVLIGRDMITSLGGGQSAPAAPTGEAP